VSSSRGPHAACVACAALAAVLAPCRAVPATDVELRISAGWEPLHRVVADESAAGPLLGLALLARAGPLLAGPAVAVMTASGAAGDQSLYAGFAAGYALDVREGWRVAVLAEGGLHAAELFPEGSRLVVRSGSASLPYAGLRAELTWAGEHPRRFADLWSRFTTFGLSAFARRDLRTATSTVEYYGASCLLCGPAPLLGTVPHVIGGWSAGVTFDTGVRW
jgi:hypothetical protein